MLHVGQYKPQLHAMPISPLVMGSAGKFRPVVSCYRSRIAAKQRNAVKNMRYLHASDPKGNSDHQLFLHGVIHAGKALNPATGSQRALDEIHRPGQIGRSSSRRSVGRTLRHCSDNKGDTLNCD